MHPAIHAAFGLLDFFNLEIFLIFSFFTSSLQKPAAALYSGGAGARWDVVRMKPLSFAACSSAFVSSMRLW
ncbi:hypothetical protein DUNSADRAFT_8439 [Dunaliella salina]|uniref:Secreted protein n=1 Tax=Dunaliella salina TaxID=3046 RepID=A0ABQ7GJL5_DUNSA|nr:hypothetical protein DUNSADRAFT_8439 [Dunaliella salina]|eukprot:KAF5834798.1 hypothetical protein DUNSADRAFT_8439 [Dunaliella salina]